MAGEVSRIPERRVIDNRNESTRINLFCVRKIMFPSIFDHIFIVIGMCVVYIYVYIYGVCIYIECLKSLPGGALA